MCQPVTKIVFLGVEIDCLERTLSLPLEKLDETRLMIKRARMKKRFRKKELQKIIGKLNWCARVVTGGRTFMRNLINIMVTLKCNHHHTRLSAAAKADLAWWDSGLEVFHGHTPFFSDVALPSHQFSTDACLVGGGAAFENDWFYVSWCVDLPEIQSSHINSLELQTVLIAAEKWGNSWFGKTILVRSDNMAAVSALNKGTSRGLDLLGIIQRLFWLSVKYSFKLTAMYLPGSLNILSDRISRMNDVNCAYQAQQMLTNEQDLEVNGHMSHDTFIWLLQEWEKMNSKA